MRAREFIVEDSMQYDSMYSLPATYVIPKLQNQDPYRQYRFGVAIARAKGRSSDNQNYSNESSWGENQVIVSYSNTAYQWIDDALKEIGLSPNDKKMISTPTSEEMPSINKVCPVANWSKK